MIVLLIALLAAASARPYHPVGLRVLAAADPGHWPAAVATHVELRGFLTYRKIEADGDLHLRLCDRAWLVGMNRERCVVAECIPSLPCDAPPIGSELLVRGISRYDAEAGHGWWEVHPVESLEVVD